MARKTVTALIDMVNPIIDHLFKQNIEFTTDVYDSIPLTPEQQVAVQFEEHVCREVQTNNNPDYDWARGYVHRTRPELIRTELIVVIL